MATIREREGKKSTSYQVRYKIKGEEGTETFKTEKEAKKFAKEIEANKTLNISVENNKIKFKDFTTRFLEFHLDDLKSTTIGNYKNYVKLLNNHFGDMRVIDITPKDIDDYFMMLKKDKNLKVNTLRKYRDILKLILKYAKIEKIIKENPSDDLIFKFNKKEKKENKYFAFHEIKHYLDLFDMEYYKQLVLLGYYTGLRKGEMLALTWSSINFENRTVRIHKNWNKYRETTTPKNDNEREMYIHDGLLYLLYEIKEFQRENKEHFEEVYNDYDLVICKYNGDPLNTGTVSKTFTEKNKTHGTKLTPHKLRHTFASKLNEINQSDLQNLLGHSNREMTEHYQHHHGYSEDTQNRLNKTFKSGGQNVVKSKENLVVN